MGLSRDVVREQPPDAVTSGTVVNEAIQNALEQEILREHVTIQSLLLQLRSFVYVLCYGDETKSTALVSPRRPLSVQPSAPLHIHNANHPSQDPV